VPIRTRQWNDPAEEGDGTRILITRYRPRGVKKSDETWDQWLANLGPSRELHAAIYAKTGPGISWSTYRMKYLQEMRSQTKAIIKLARRVTGGEMITLLCSSHCVNENRCHRSLLRNLIEIEAEKLRQTPKPT
jgi:uncharacterized protein YeaO (DUF488 family)